jgi:SPP1 family predicted phage head-tail adaptor
VTEFLPSSLRHRVTLERPERTSDGAGGFIRSWAEEAALWADIRPSSGGERVEADRMAGRLSHEISLRYRPGVVPEMRFRQGTRLFHILAVIDVEERRRWLKCLCEEREL